MFRARSLERVEIAVFDFGKGIGICFELRGDGVAEGGQCGTGARIVNDSIPFFGRGKFRKNGGEMVDEFLALLFRKRPDGFFDFLSGTH